MNDCFWIRKAKLLIHEDCNIGVKCFSTFAGKHPYRSVFFNKYSCCMQLKPIFIQKEVLALVFSWQLSEIFNNNFFKERKKALLWEKKHCYKKCGSDIYRKSTYATFFCNFAKISVFEQGVSTVYSNNRYIVLSVEKKSLKVVNSTLTIGFWRSLTCQNSHVDICPLGRLDWLISMQCSHKTFHFLSASDGPTSILSDIVISLR